MFSVQCRSLAVFGQKGADWDSGETSVHEARRTTRGKQVGAWGKDYMMSMVGLRSTRKSRQATRNEGEEVIGHTPMTASVVVDCGDPA